MFYVGWTYKTQAGNPVTIIEESEPHTNYHTVLGDDGIWRYARKIDAGRVTGSPFDASDPNNLVEPDEYAVILNPKV